MPAQVAAPAHSPEAQGATEGGGGEPRTCSEYKGSTHPSFVLGIDSKYIHLVRLESLHHETRLFRLHQFDVPGGDEYVRLPPPKLRGGFQESVMLLSVTSLTTRGPSGRSGSTNTPVVQYSLSR
ncbi:hypothetical protein Pcinc_000301 [Petrolisthes cinctipes]|uniref:Uncharacterized protein n=1 Tax=Petrolisthes cinctipes TaxID=88211 RepID=A0AAE1GPV4_PETCI|nr:hypothetical protein Pcinc_000301 [Petrolisthes cinctipes]